MVHSSEDAALPSPPPLSPPPLICPLICLFSQMPFHPTVAPAHSTSVFVCVCGGVSIRCSTIEGGGGGREREREREREKFIDNQIDD